jgi:short-subunit dehydrogenase
MAALRPVALITGASSGIGAALARRFAANGHDLALVSLPDANLAALADEIAAGGRPRPLTVQLDLTLRDAGLRIARDMAAHGVEPAFVVNCAGFGLVGPATALDQNAQLAMLDLNVRALTDLSLRFADSVIRHRGGILNVASVSAFLPAPEMAVYNASKTYVLWFGEALHQELAGNGVRVTTLCSGPVATQFQLRAGIRAKLPRLLARSPEVVARAAYDGLMKGRRVVIPGFGNKALRFVLRLIPRAILLPGQVYAMRFSTKPPARGLPKLSAWTEPGQLPP